MPIILTSSEKTLAIAFFKKFGMTPMAKKMFLCAYYANRKFNGFITLEQFVHSSMMSPDLSSLSKHWISNGTGTFFGFNKNIIRDWDMTDLESHITLLTHDIPEGERSCMETYDIRAKLGITDRTVPVHRNNNI